MGCLQVKPCKNTVKSDNLSLRGRSAGKRGNCYRKKWGGAGGPHPPNHTSFNPAGQNDSYYMKKWGRADGTRLSRPRPAGCPLSWGMGPVDPPVTIIGPSSSSGPKTSASGPLTTATSPVSSTTIVTMDTSDAIQPDDNASTGGIEDGEMEVSGHDAFHTTYAKREVARLLLRRLYDLNTAFIMAIDKQKMLENRQHLQEENEEEEEGEEDGENDEKLKNDTKLLTKSNGRRGRGRRSRKKRGKKGRRATRSVSITGTTTDVEITSWLNDIMTDVAEDIESDKIVSDMLAELDAFQTTPSKHKGQNFTLKKKIQMIMGKD